MTKKTIYLIGIALTIIIGAYLYSKYCCNAVGNYSNRELTNLSEKYNGAFSGNRFSLSTNDFSFSCANNFRFKKEGFDILMPIGDSIDIGIFAIKQYLENNPDFELTIKGTSGSEEQNSSVESKLGIARANTVKNYFVSKGIDSSKILTNGEICENLTEEGGIVYGSIKYSIKQPENFENFKNNYNSSPITIHFDSNKAESILSTENNQNIDLLVNNLKKYSDAELVITGHTDNTGSNATNFTLGQKRAQFLKNLLIKNGFEAGKIKTGSKGEDEPIADNSTEQGKANNRRATVIIN